jgi:hypothetical protein
MTLLAHAQQYHAAGLSVLPARRKEKRPAIPFWKEYQSQLPSANHIVAWFANAPDAICVICGQVSGNLEVLDFDNQGELFDAWRASIPQEICDRLVIEKTPSGGYHVAYRCQEGISGNLKLAMGLRDGKRMTLIETRGEGGLVLCAPTEGYELLQGDYTHLGTLSGNERITLLDAAWRLNELVEENKAEKQAREDTRFTLRPGDDYNARGDFPALLQAHGWKYLQTMPDGNQHWRRPGKMEDKTSATLKDGSFYVFSSNAAPFESVHSYNAFGAYTLLEHGGDYTKASSELFRQGYGKAAEEHPDVDLSGLLGQPVEPVVHLADPEMVKPKGNLAGIGGDISTTTKNAAFPDPGELPEQLTHIPGFIDDFVEWSMSSAPHPNRILSFAGALAFLSYLAGRKVVSDRNTLTNLYLIVLADSGVGKDHPRKVNMTTAITCGIGGGVIDDVASGAGLEDALFLHPTLLLQKDEFDTLFNALKYAKDNNSETMLGRLLSIYGSSNSTLKLRNKAMNRNDLLKLRDDMKNGLYAAGQTIVNPYLVIFGTAIPEFFYESLSPRLLSNGMGARCILLTAGRRSPQHRSKFIAIPDSLKSSIDTILSYGRGGNLGSVNPELMTISAEPEADSLLDETGRQYDGVYLKHQKLREQIPMAFWARAYEKVVKLSMLYSISANVTSPIITKEAVEWAGPFVDFVTRQSLFLVSSYSYENPFDEKCQKVVRFIRAAGGSYGHSELLHRSHESKELFQKIIETLTENETIVSSFVDTGGKRLKRVYSLCGP